ncbi:MAG: hypothetical protein PF450_11785 [Bacteroidales bacterium]|jgi:hypothetical protein|nr:hypothetical protein [Bacteroidales bacterium]
MGKNYLEIYKKNAKTPKFQAGGPMSGEAPAPAPGGGEEQGGGLEQAIMQVVESQDPQMALQVVMMIAETMGLTGGAQGGAPMPAPEGTAPMGRYGMKLPIFKKQGVFK